MFVSRKGKDRAHNENENCANDGSDGPLLRHLSGKTTGPTLLGRFHPSDSCSYIVPGSLELQERIVLCALLTDRPVYGPKTSLCCDHPPPPWVCDGQVTRQGGVPASSAKKIVSSACVTTMTMRDNTNSYQTNV